MPPKSTLRDGYPSTDPGDRPPRARRDNPENFGGLRFQAASVLQIVINQSRLLKELSLFQGSAVRRRVAGNAARFAERDAIQGVSGPAAILPNPPAQARIQITRGWAVG